MTLARTNSLPTLLDLSRLEPKIAERILAARSSSTWARYEKALRRFQRWCEERGEQLQVPVPPELVARWLSSLADEGLSASTLYVSSAAVRALHETGGHESPTNHPQVRALLKGARRELTAQQVVHQADPILVDDLRTMVAQAYQTHPRYQVDGQLLSRDLALLLFGWAGGFRREELAALRVEQLQFDRAERSVIVRLDHAKNRVGEPHERRLVAADASDLCPIGALETWLSSAGISEGHVFRRFSRGRITARPITGSTVDAVVRRFATALPRDVGRKLIYSAHSLRAGIATAAALADKPDRDIADHLGHRSVSTTQRYVRTARVRKGNLTKGIL